MKKVALLISGGVDSSVALALLKEQGLDVTAFYLKIWLEDELSYLGECPWQEDLSLVEKVCEQFNVPLQVISLQREYHDRVVAYVVSEARAGRTPSPDLLCNQYIKFGAFFDAIDKTYDKIVSGHYSTVAPPSEETGGRWMLKRAVDKVKDQSYFLSRLSQEQLSRIHFPLGGYAKEEVRKLAQKFDLPNKERADSQGICFLGKIPFDDFIKHHLKVKVGELVEVESGKVVGKHQGFWFFTIGQRKGIGLSGGPWYVVKKDAGANRVYISNEYHEKSNERKDFIVGELNFFCKPETLLAGKIFVKVRHAPHAAPCSIRQRSEGSSWDVFLEDGDQGLAPGQYAVFYDENYCLASGVIL